MICFWWPNECFGRLPNAAQHLWLEIYDLSFERQVPATHQDLMTEIQIIDTCDEFELQIFLLGLIQGCILSWSCNVSGHYPRITSFAVLAETWVRSHRKLFVFVMRTNQIVGLIIPFFLFFFYNGITAYDI